MTGFPLALVWTIGLTFGCLLEWFISRPFVSFSSPASIAHFLSLKKNSKKKQFPEKSASLLLFLKSSNGTNCPLYSATISPCLKRSFAKTDRPFSVFFTTKKSSNSSNLTSCSFRLFVHPEHLLKHGFLIVWREKKNLKTKKTTNHKQKETKLH